MAGTLLSNDNGTGLLDELIREHEVMVAAIMNVSFADAGLMGLFYVPKGLVSGLKKAEQLSVAAVGKIGKGDFTDEELEDSKKAWLKSFDLGLEDSESRAMRMVSLYTAGKSWDDYMAMRERVASLTREDVMRVMNAYIGQDKLVLEKKTGNYPKDQLPKPEYGAVEPQREITESEYAKELIARHRNTLTPRFIDMESDMRIGEEGNNRVISVDNPYNDIFRLEMRYAIGEEGRPLAGYLSGYLDYCGTDSLTHTEFQRKLRAMGAKAWFFSGDRHFSVCLEGPESAFAESYAILDTFLKGLKPSDKGKSAAVSGQKMYEKSRAKSGDDVAEAAAEKLLYGANAAQLREMSADELKKTDDGALLTLLGEILGYRCGVYYSGSLAPQEVAATVGLVEDEKPVEKRAYFPLRDLAGDEVWLAEMKSSRQSIVEVYIRTDELAGERDRHLARLLNMYMGGLMNSLLFQEIREFRSFAYTASSSMLLPDPDHVEKTALFNCYMTTQADKTGDAIEVLYSILRNVEFTQERFEKAVRQMLNNINNSFPGFRRMAAHTDAYLLHGYDEDPNKGLYETLQKVTLDDLSAFYDKHVRDRAMLTVITGDSNAIGKETVSALGAKKVDTKTLFKK